MYRNKAEVLNHLLVASNNANESKAAMSSLLQCFDQIQAVEFIVNLVLQTPYPNLEDTLQMLHYTKNRVKSHLSDKIPMCMYIEFCVLIYLAINVQVKSVGSPSKEDGVAAMRIKV